MGVFDLLSRPRLQCATVRGLACFALVAYHVVGPDQTSGMHLPDGSPWHLAMNSFDFLRMPMFTALSGFLYASHRADSKNLLKFYGKKAARLLLPLLFVTVVVFALRKRVYQGDIAFTRALFYHYEHLWYLQALILIFLIVGAWDALRRPDWVELCIVGFAAVMISRTFATTSFLSINGALYLLPYFLMGMVLRTQEDLLSSPELRKLTAAIVAVVLVIQQASQAFGGNELNRFTLPAALCGISGAYLLLVHCPRIRLAELVGRYSYTIFLWHSVAASGARHALESSLGQQTGAEFTILLAVGICVPIAVHHIVCKIPVLSLLAAGVKTSGDQYGKVLTASRLSAPRKMRPLAFTVAMPSRLARVRVRGRRVNNEYVVPQREVA